MSLKLEKKNSIDLSTASLPVNFECSTFESVNKRFRMFDTTRPPQFVWKLIQFRSCGHETANTTSPFQTM